MYDRVKKMLEIYLKYSHVARNNGVSRISVSFQVQKRRDWVDESVSSWLNEHLRNFDVVCPEKKLLK